jgi:predicted PurR-regulated permease PerM
MLVLVFTFLFLLHREKYENFFVLMYKDEKREDAKAIISKVSKIAQQYLSGRAISIIILTVFYTVGLLILGIKNAFLLSAIAAIVTFIPYVGPVIGGLLPFFMALVSNDSFGPALGVLIVISLAQLIDNYFIEPYVVGGNVNVSPFFTIFILIVGGLVWGIAGVILFLPLLGMIKIILDNVEGLYPYAFLIGDQNGDGGSNGIMKKIKGMFKKKDKEE